MYRRHTMETVQYQYQDRTTATSNVRLTQIKIKGKQTAVLQTFFGCGNNSPVNVIWLHERSEWLKFFEVLRSLSVQVWCLSGRQMREEHQLWLVSIDSTRDTSTRHIFMHVALMTTVSKSHHGTMHDFFLTSVLQQSLNSLMVLCISEPKPGVNPWSQMWIKESMKKTSIRDRKIWF